MSYASTVIADGAVGYWRLGESAFGSAAVDQIGTKNGAYVNSSGITVGQPGIPGGDQDTAVLFTAASSGYVNVGDAGGLHVGDLCSFEAWVTRVNVGASMSLWSNVAGGMTVKFEADNKVALVKPTVGVLARSSTTLTDTTSWHHIVVTKNGAARTIYIDSVDVTANVSAQTLIDTTGVFIGTDGGSSDYYSGKIDEVALYPTALSAGTVSSHYTLGITRNPFVNITVAI